MDQATEDTIAALNEAIKIIYQHRDRPLWLEDVLYEIVDAVNILVTKEKFRQKAVD